MYIAIALIITILAFHEIYSRKSSSKISNVVWIVLTLLLCFRFGQGTDYFNYYSQYESIGLSGSVFKNSLYHGEPGWYVLMLISKRMGLSFEWFIGIISLIMMFLIRHGIEKYSPYKTLSYLLLFPTYYMTYCASAIRQGIVFAIFIGIGIELLQDNKKKKYSLLIMAISMIHYSAIVLLLPLLSDIIYKSKKMSVIWVPFVAVIVFVIYLFTASYLSQFGFSSYLNNSYSIGGIVMRIIMAGIVWLLYINKGVTLKSMVHLEKMLFACYFIGFAIFLAFSFTGIFAQRLTMPFKTLEVYLIPILVYQNRNLLMKKLSSKAFSSVVVIVFLMNVELVKNIGSYIEQGEYNADINVLNYPYVSVFDKSTIYECRHRMIILD